MRSKGLCNPCYTYLQSKKNGTISDYKKYSEYYRRYMREYYKNNPEQHKKHKEQMCIAYHKKKAIKAKGKKIGENKNEKNKYKEENQFYKSK